MSPSDLAQVLSALPLVTDPAVLVGTSTADDAAVYKVSDELAIIQTVDFFTPIVDSPWSFGAISAANSISDVYAMGGRPIMAMNVVGYPRNNPKAPLSALGEILKGGAAKAAEAGVSVVGGHTIDDNEPKYGMSVTGFVHPDKIWRNVGAHPGDKLVLTKPLGTGIISTAMRAGVAPPAVAEAAIVMMSLLNRGAAEAASDLDIHACTDVTGFGLLGHLREMLGGSLDAEIDAASVGLLGGVLDLLAQGHLPGGSRRNRSSLESILSVAPSVAAPLVDIFCDAQTSGGLLFALADDQAAILSQRCAAAGVPAFTIGSFSDGSGRISLR